MDPGKTMTALFIAAISQPPARSGILDHGVGEQLLAHRLEIGALTLYHIELDSLPARTSLTPEKPSEAEAMVDRLALRQNDHP